MVTAIVATVSTVTVVSIAIATVIAVVTAIAVIAPVVPIAVVVVAAVGLRERAGRRRDYERGGGDEDAECAAPRTASMSVGHVGETTYRVRYSRRSDRRVHLSPTRGVVVSKTVNAACFSNTAAQCSNSRAPSAPWSDRMTTSLAELKAQVRAQKTAIPGLYGRIDFDRVPERFAAGAHDKSMLPEPFARKYRADILRNPEKVERALAYTMLGDTVADAYAALIPTYGFRRLMEMLRVACERGVEAVKDAPPELERFIASMAATPDWLDRKLSAKGARATRVSMATLAPFVIRGAFIATFMNKYSGLPMALTGTLSQDACVQRVKETASFFTTASLPGALDRFGQGFRAAAMVRLMHSMVRANLLMRPGKWDVDVFGIPIPQIDQMPAGTMASFIAAYLAVKEKRDFTRRERAIVEHGRHQCHLLGLPQDLLLETPEEIFDAMLTYSATLRDGYDDATNGELVRTTMGAYFPADTSMKSQLVDRIERSVSKVFFTQAFRVPRATARRMGVVPSALDYGIFAAFQAFALPQLAGHMVVERIPIANAIADAHLIARIDDLLASYGHAEYATDPAKYRAA